MVQPNKCPHCGSDRSVYKPKAGEWECQDCEQRFRVDAARLPTGATDPKHIFFSYGHDANRELVDRFKADLERRGHTVWIDYKDIGAWDDWKGRITQGIHDADLAIAFLSKHSTRDPGVCRNEIAMALYHFGTAYPVLVEPKTQVDVPSTVKHLQLLDLHEWRPIRDGQVAGQDFERWYEQKLIEVTNRVEGEYTRFADEAGALRQVLRPNSFDSLFAQHLEGFVGREWVFEEFERWLERPESRLFWLKAGPGFGKTAFAVNLADRRRDAVVGSWFCRQQSSELRDPKQALCTLAFQLALRWEDYRTRLLPRLNIYAGSAEEQLHSARQNLERKILPDLFHLLLAEPLAGLIWRKHKLVILIDALDEASDAQGGNALTRLLVEQLESLPSWIGFVVTSRPDASVVNLLQGFKPIEIAGDDPRNAADLEAYGARSQVLRQHLSSLTEEQRQDRIRRLLEKSEGMVLYLKLVEEGLREGSLTLAGIEALEAGLNGLFSRYLQGFEARFGADYESGKQPLLRLVVGARGALPLELARQVLGWDREAINKVRARIGSYLVDAIDGVTLFHKSLAEWLTTSSSGRFMVDGEAGGKQLAEFLWKAFEETEDKKALVWPEQTKKWLPAWLPTTPAWNDIDELAEYGDYLADAYCWGGAEKVLRRLVEVCETELNAEHPATATSLLSLGRLFSDRGDYSHAEPLIRRALAIREQALGPDHPDTGGGLTNLALLLSRKDDYVSAEPLYRRALAIGEQALGPDHPDTGGALNNLALLLRKKGDYASAEPLYRRALAISEQALGPDHPTTATSLSNLAVLLSAKGDDASAEPLIRRALAISERALGPDRPGTGTMLHNLASLLSEKGDDASAEPLYRRALAISEQALGPDHPDTGTNLHQLAALLSRRGEHEGAEPLCRRALAISEQALGPDHPRTGTIVASLATLLSEQGKLTEAERCLRRQLAIVERNQGPRCLAISESLCTLADILQQMGDLSGAKQALQRALTIYESAEDSQESNISNVLFQLGSLLRESGELAEAERYLRRDLAIVEETQGAQCLSYGSSLNNLAGLLEEMGDLTGAAQMRQRAQTIMESADH